MASACKSLRECERWRGELLREISRKVAKIQDAGLSDYEIRDINDDEINKLMRDKRHWENQIVALGGEMLRWLDDDGKEVPGTKGYKYFGRAKELPVEKKEEDEENQALAFYKKFMGQGPAYYGDLQENDGSLLQFESEAENEDWEEACSNLRNAPLPVLPRQARTSPLTSSDSSHGVTKRKAGDGDDDSDMPPSEDVKRGQRGLALGSRTNPDPCPSGGILHSISYSRDLTIPPKLPTHDEMEAILLALRKKALVEEYFGGGESKDDIVVG
ncbi:Isy1-like splicing factor [Mycena olivaceomarginata]|nr:Isy1-like splicing factor [Mycena olivaceomarginata]